MSQQFSLFINSEIQRFQKDFFECQYFNELVELENRYTAEEIDDVKLADTLNTMYDTYKDFPFDTWMELLGANVDVFRRLLPFITDKTLALEVKRIIRRVDKMAQFVNEGLL